MNSDIKGQVKVGINLRDVKFVENFFVLQSTIKSLFRNLCIKLSLNTGLRKLS